MLRLLAALLLTCALTARAQPRLPLGEDEALTYRVSWGLWGGLAEIKVVAQPTSDASKKPELRIVTTTATKALAKALVTFEARGESVFDLQSGKLLSLTETSRTGEKRASHEAFFDYDKKVANYASPPGSTQRPLEMPAGDPMDLITSLLQTRNWSLKIGEKRDALVLFNDDFYELTIYAVGLEEVKTKLGTFQALVLEPYMEKTAPKGMFKKGSKVKVWISQDERRLPVRFQVAFSFGTGVATLSDYRPPLVKVAAAMPTPPAAPKTEK